MNHIIFSIIKSFSNNEIKRLTIFIESPYHNKSKKLILFFREIKKYYPNFDFQKFDKESLMKKINVKLNYNDSTFRNLMSDFTSMVGKFITLEKFLEDDWEKNVYLLKSLTERKNEMFFEKNLLRADFELSKKGIDSTYFYDKSVLELSKFNFNILNLNEKSKVRIESNTSIISSYVIYLVIFFIMEVINSYLHLTVHEVKYKLHDKKGYVSKIIQTINFEELFRHLKESSPDAYVIGIYLSLLNAFREIENPEKFLKYKSLVLKYSKCFSKDELAYHFSMLISYCIIRNSITQYRFYMDDELFKIYNIFLREKYFLDRKSLYLDESLYRNIIITSLRLEKYKWTFSFIEDYAKYLHPEKHENLTNLSYAEYNYHKGSQTCSTELLNIAFNYLKKIQEESFVIKYDIKILYLMLYYDLDYVDENMITQVNNYRKFLRRNKLVSENRKKRLNKFLNLFEKLVFLKSGDHKINISSLYIDILSSNGLNYHQWLLNKVQQFDTKNTLKLKSV
ncbi:MAG: hypothetical protein ABIY50_10740 [Ignavibacteria bacterium]